MSSQWWTQPPIVLVEDDVNDELFLRSALLDARIGNPLVVFSAAEPARAHVSAKLTDPPALFLLDIHVHGAETGLDFLRWIREQPSPLGSTPAIVLTGSGHAEHRSESMGLGALSFLSKPVAAIDLITCIQALGFDNIPDPTSGDVGFRVICRHSE